MVEDRGPGRPLHRGKMAALDDARDRHELMAARAIEVVVVRANQLETGPPVVEQNLAYEAIGGKLLGGAKHGREVGHPPAPAYLRMQLFERPGVALAVTH